MMHDASQIIEIKNRTEKISWQNPVVNTERRHVIVDCPIGLGRLGNPLITNLSGVYVGLNARKMPVKNVAIQNETGSGIDYRELLSTDMFYGGYSEQDAPEMEFDVVQDLADPFLNRNTLLTAYPSSATARSDDLPKFGLDERLLMFVRKLARDAVDEVFHDGQESKFGAAVTAVISEYGRNAVRAVEKILETTSVNIEVAGELLRVLGMIEDRFTQHQRLMLLVNQLKSDDARVRDAASLGLAALEDPRAIPALELALQDETNPFVRPEFESAIEELRESE